MVKVVLGVEDDGRAGPFQRLPCVERWLHRCDLTRPLLQLAMGRMQRGATIDAHGLPSLLELMLAGLVVFLLLDRKSVV